MRFFILALVLAGTANATTIGIRNHNPGNIISRHPMAWEGAVGKDAWQHIKFKDEVHGLRAIRVLLGRYWRKHRINTAFGIANRWLGKNNSYAHKMQYARIICKYTGKKPHDALDMTDRQTLMRIAQGIVQGENSKSPYTEAMWHKAFRGLDG